MKRYKLTAVALLILATFSLRLLNAQEKEKLSPDITLQSFKDSDGKRTLKALLAYSKNRMQNPLPGFEITFFSGTNKAGIENSITGTDGIASLALVSGQKISEDGKGVWTISAEFPGNDSINPCSSEITVKDVILEMTLSGDSVRTVSLKAYSMENGKAIPAKGEVVKIGVPRMFNILPVGEVTLDDAGEGSLEFPSDLPGDKDGNLTVISKFEENPTFGTVEKNSVVKWGIPADYSKPIVHRALWTQVAPRWMIFTLTILLTGVWGHYMFAILSLIRIRRDASKKEKEEHRS
jgi:hypothetical protein